MEAALFFSGEAAAAFRRAMPSSLQAALGSVRALVISERAAAWRRGRGGGPGGGGGAVGPPPRPFGPDRRPVFLIRKPLKDPDQ